MANHAPSAVIMLLLLALLAGAGLARHVSEVETSARFISTHVHKRGLRFSCQSPDCNPDPYSCITWKNPCPVSPLLPAERQTPQCTTCGTCISNIAFDAGTGAFTYDLQSTPCPASACAFSFAAALAKDKGCASSLSTVEASAKAKQIWKATSNSAAVFLARYLSGDMTIEDAAYSFAYVLAESYATSCIKAVDLVCYCCDEPSFELSKVKAATDVTAQSVAQAAVDAIASVQAIAKIGDAYQDIWATSIASARAVAADVQRVTDEVYQSLKGTTNKADRFYLTPKKEVACKVIEYDSFKKRVAKAMVCTVVSAFAKVHGSGKFVADYTNEVAPCSNSYAVGYGYDPRDRSSKPAGMTTQCTVDCPCKGCGETYDGGCQCSNKCKKGPYGQCQACVYADGHCKRCSDNNCQVVLDN